MKTESKTENEYHAALRLASFEPDPEIDPALILNASTTANFLERRRARRASLSGPQTMDDEALHNLILATSPVSSGTGGASTPTDDAAIALSSSTPGYTRTTMSGSPSPPSYSTSPHRSGRARSYAGLRLCRVAKNVSKCRAIANIRVTAEPPRATRHIVPVLHLGGEVHIYLVLLLLVVCFITVAIEIMHDSSPLETSSFCSHVFQNKIVVRVSFFFKTVRSI